MKNEPKQQYVSALVNVAMSKRKAAAVLGVKPSEVVQIHNGAAVVAVKPKVAETLDAEEVAHEEAVLEAEAEEGA